MRATAALSLLLILGLALSQGCGKSSIDGHTRPTILMINGGMPLHADVFFYDSTMAGGGVIPQEVVDIVFTNPPSQRFLELTPDDPYGNFILDSFRMDYDIIQYLPVGAGFDYAATLPSITGGMNLTIPVGTEVTTSFVLAPAALKMMPPVSDIMPGGSVPMGELVTNVTIYFTGHEQGSDRQVVLTAYATVLFADYADED